MWIKSREDEDCWNILFTTEISIYLISGVEVGWPLTKDRFEFFEPEKYWARNIAAVDTISQHPLLLFSRGTIQHTLGEV